jgi:hypothetical protein
MYKEWDICGDGHGHGLGHTKIKDLKESETELKKLEKIERKKMFLFQGGGGKSKNRKPKSGPTVAVVSPSSSPDTAPLIQPEKKGGVMTTSSGGVGGILSKFSVRFNPEVYVMIFLLSVGFLFLFYHHSLPQLF